MSDVPPEIIMDILSRLPVKSLLRFRCVSRSLKVIIGSSSFVKAHLGRQLLKTNSDLKLVLQSHALFSVDFSSIGSQPKELDQPFKHSYGPTQVLGSCHGLFLLSNVLDDHAVWNPSTKMFRKLPGYDLKPPEVKEATGSGLAQFFDGFGYDILSDDYKVLNIGQWFHFSDSILVSQTMIYSLKLGSWKKVEDCPYWLRKEDYGTLAGGVLHWIASKDPWSPFVVIAGFNLGNEKFQLVPYPDNLGMPFQLNLAVLGECLCLRSSHVTDPTNADNSVLDHIDIWVMKDYGVKQSWVKLFSVGQLNGCQCVRPIAYSVTGKEVLLEMDHRKFYWYSLEKGSRKRARVTGELDLFESFVCLETLVPLDGGGNNDKEDDFLDKRGKGRSQKKREDEFLSKGFKLKL